jgi:hypothetical protein
MSEPSNRPRLRVIGDVPEGWAPVEGIPAECPTERLCRFVRCPHSLLLREGSSRPGRRWPGRKLPDVVVVASPTATACTLDFVDRHPAGASGEEVGRALGCDKRTIELVTAAAITKLAGSPEAEALARELLGRETAPRLNFARPSVERAHELVMTNVAIVIMIDGHRIELTDALARDAVRLLRRTHLASVRDYLREQLAPLKEKP